MQEQAPDLLINLPSIDFAHYFVAIKDFFVDHFNYSPELVRSITGLMIGIAIPLSVLLFIFIVIIAERLKTLRKMEDERYNSKVDMAYTDSKSVVVESKKGNPDIARKWDLVLTHLESQNKNDWRQAVLEADIILGELLTMLGYRGDGIGEQLKRATKADFKTLDDAWDAHKVRNELAHSGSDFPFSQSDARRVISMYRRVFDEFFYI